MGIKAYQFTPLKQEMSHFRGWPVSNHQMCPKVILKSVCTAIKKKKNRTKTWSRRLKQIGNKRTPLKHPVLKHRAWHAVALSSTETDSPATPLRNRKGSADSIPKNWETRMATGYWWDVTGYQLGKNWDFLMGCLNNIFFSCQKQHEWILMGCWWDININVVGYQLSIGNEEVSRNILLKCIPYTPNALVKILFRFPRQWEFQWYCIPHFRRHPRMEIWMSNLGLTRKWDDNKPAYPSKNREMHYWIDSEWQELVGSSDLKFWPHLWYDRFAEPGYPSNQTYA